MCPAPPQPTSTREKPVVRSAVHCGSRRPANAHALGSQLMLQADTSSMNSPRQALDAESGVWYCLHSSKHVQAKFSPGVWLFFRPGRCTAPLSQVRAGGQMAPVGAPRALESQGTGPGKVAKMKEEPMMLLKTKGRFSGTHDADENKKLSSANPRC